VRVHFRVSAQPQLAVQPPEVQMHRDPESGDWVGELDILNSGYGLMDVTLHVDASWLSIPRESYRVRRGRPVRVLLHASAEAPTGVESHLVIRAGEQNLEVPVNLD
jgi:hypothetical protein